MRNVVFGAVVVAITFGAGWLSADDRIDVVAEGCCPNDGNGDAAASINAVIAKAGGRTVYVPEGVYLLEGSIVPVSGTRLVVSGKAEMRRGFDGGNGSRRGALIQGDPSFTTKDVSITGGTWTNPGNKFSGRVINLIGQHWTVESVVVQSWASHAEGSICMAVFGSDIVVRKCRMVGSARRRGQAGIRVMSGSNIRVTDCYVESGDDAFCAFPVERANSFGAGRSLQDVLFERCRGKSFDARFLACGLTAVNSLNKGQATLDGLNNVKVSDITFTDCQGESACERPFAPAMFVASANPNPNAGVSGIRFIRCIGRVTGDAEQCVKVAATAGATCSDVVFDDCTITGGIREPVTVTRGCRSVILTDCLIDGVRKSVEW